MLTRPGRIVASPRSRAPPAAEPRSARRPILAGPRFAHREVAPLERLLVEALDHFLGDRTLGELDEREAAGTAGLAIDRHDHMGRLCDGREVGPEIRFGGVVR